MAPASGQQPVTSQQPVSGQQPAVPGRPAAAAGQNAEQLAAEQENIPTTLPATPRTGTLNLQNASLTEVIDVLARQLKINYILDPRVKGGVTINTYGETKDLDSTNLLDMILRINGAAMVKSGDIYRIVPAARASAHAEAEDERSADIEDDRCADAEPGLSEVRQRG